MGREKYTRDGLCDDEGLRGGATNNGFRSGRGMCNTYNIAMLRLTAIDRLLHHFPPFDQLARAPALAHTYAAVFSAAQLNPE